MNNEIEVQPLTLQPKYTIWLRKSSTLLKFYSINFTSYYVKGVKNSLNQTVLYSKQGHALNWVEGLSDEAYYPWESPKKST